MADTEFSPNDGERLEKELRRFARALSRLRDDQRVVLELKHLEGLTLNEMCVRTGYSKQQVAGLLFQGLKALRVLLDESHVS